MGKNPFDSVMGIFNSLIREGFEKFGRYYSKYRGFVSDNADPDGFSRLKLVIPEITGKFPLEYWAWPGNNYSGDGYGMQIIPQKGDMVWVEFEKGNPRAPIWNFGHFGEKPDGAMEKPEELKDVKNYWFMTPEGQRIELDDTNKQIVLTLLEKLMLGDKDVTEPGVLGNILKTKLETLCTKTALACTKAQSMNTKVATITVPTAVGPSGVPVNAADFITLATDFAQIKADVDSLKSELGDVLSEIIFLK